ncbi:carboxylic acid reductase [Streptomyces sp. NPDC045456]|uniref:carboxylic acid reductase n=1 Tax=Streptomyces sp. NPDC045456 TaxID=3155254 RepID=UPI0034024C3E
MSDSQPPTDAFTAHTAQPPTDEFTTRTAQPPTDAFTQRTAQRAAHLYATDPQFRDAAPLDAVTEAIRRPGLTLADLVATVMEGYADRPALGERATEPVTDPDTGRTTLRLLERFDTITYGELWERVGAVASDWRHQPGHAVGRGDVVALLGPTSAEYTLVDLACVRSGAVSVPLQAGASAEHLAPVVAQSGPRLLAVDVAHLDVALQLAADTPSLDRVVVLGHRPEITAHQEKLDFARDRLAAQGRGVSLDTLASVIERGRALPPAPRCPEGATADTLSSLIYTSGSTGTPKGAMYTERLVRQFWVDFVPGQGVRPSIVLNYLPLSHMMGRGVLFGTLARGGIACFVASSDLSTLFEDLSLVRPTEFIMVPRVSDMLFQRYQAELARRSDTGVEGDTSEQIERVQAELRTELREEVLGGRLLWAVSASAPLSAEMTAFVENCLHVRLLNGYGSTEAGIVSLDGRVLRPPVTDHKLADVPELGYFRTDAPHPRGELLIKSDRLISGYFQRPDATAQVFDEDGFYRTGDIMARTGPDTLVYVDRRSNVLKLSQGEFVATSRLEALFTGSPVVRQVFVYGNSARAYLLAVIVPTQDALDRAGQDPRRLRSILRESLQRLATEAGLNAYEVPRDFLIETEPFSQRNGLLSGVRKLLRPALTKRYGERLEALYTELTERGADELQALRQAGPSQPVAETVLRAARALLGHRPGDVRSGTRFLELGGDSLSALSFSQLLKDIFHVDVPVDVLINPVNTLRQVADHIEKALAGHRRPTADSVHGPGATRLLAGDLTPDAFLDTDALAKTGRPTGPLPEARTVLLTGANGYLGRFLCLEWLERVAERGGTLVCVVRGSTDEAARKRLDASFDSGDPELLRHYRELAAEHLEVVAGDIGKAGLGLDKGTWQRLADTVDLIVHPAALVNHVLPYDQQFGPNVLGTAELIRLALTSRIKQFTYLSTVAVVFGYEAAADETADIRTACGVRDLDGGYADGYAASKWAGEVLLREAHDTYGLPVAVFRSNMILAHRRYRGQLNIPDVFTRLLLSLLATGIAPESFYARGVGADTGSGHYDGLPVDFTARAIAALGDGAREGYRTFNVVNPHEDGISLDTFVDWLVAAGHPLTRIRDHDEWLDRFGTAMRGLPDRQRQHSLLPLLHAFAEPEEPLPGSALPAQQFRAAVRAAALDEENDIPHLSQELITKYVADLRAQHLL